MPRNLDKRPKGAQGADKNKGKKTPAAPPTQEPSSLRLSDAVNAQDIRRGDYPSRRIAMNPGMDANQYMPFRRAADLDQSIDEKSFEASAPTARAPQSPRYNALPYRAVNKTDVNYGQRLAGMRTPALELENDPRYLSLQRSKAKKNQPFQVNYNGTSLDKTAEAVPSVAAETAASSASSLDAPPMIDKTKFQANRPRTAQAEDEVRFEGDLHRFLNGNTIITGNEFGMVVDGHEHQAKALLDHWALEPRRVSNAAFLQRVEDARHFLALPLRTQLKLRLQQVESRKAVAGDDTYNMLRQRFDREHKRVEGVADVDFSAKLMDDFDERRKQGMDLEEMGGRIAGIQDAVQKLQPNLAGRTSQVQGLREEAKKYQRLYEDQRAAEARKPVDKLAPELARITKEMRALGDFMNNGGLDHPNEVRARLAIIRKQLHQTDSLPEATKNPGYRAILEELDQTEASLNNLEGDELSQLLSDGARLLNEQGSAHVGPRPDLLGAAKAQADRATARLAQAEKTAPHYEGAKRDLEALQQRIEALRNPAISPRLETRRAIIPPRASEVRRESLAEEAQEPAFVAAPAAPERPSHARNLIAPNKTIDWQRFESEAQASDWVAKLNALRTKRLNATNTEEITQLDRQIVETAHLTEVALKREFILHTADPVRVANVLDTAAETHERLLADPIGAQVVERMRSLEREGRVLSIELIRQTFTDAHEQVLATQWLGVRRTTAMVEEGVGHLREFHAENHELHSAREYLLETCENCFIPEEMRRELEAATSPAQRRELVQRLVDDPETMDRPKTVGEFLRAGALIFNKMLKAFRLPHWHREFANDDLERAIPEIRERERNLKRLRDRRAEIGDLAADGASFRPAQKANAAEDTSSAESSDAFQTFMSIARQADELTTSINNFSGEVTAQVISGFNATLRTLEDDVAAYEQAPTSAKSTYDIARRELTQARQALGKLQGKQVTEAPTRAAENLSPEIPAHVGARDMVAPRETIDLQKIEDDAEGLLDEVESALREGRTLGDGAFNRIDRESILLSARLRTLAKFRSLPAYQTAERTMQELNDKLDECEAQMLNKDRTNTNRPTEVLLKSGIAANLREVLKDSPRRAALGHYLTELNDGQGVRVESIDDVQEVLLTFFNRYLGMHPVEQRNATRVFAKVAELMNFESIYSDLGVNSLDALAARVSMGATLNQPVANDVDAGNEIPVEEDLTGWAEPAANDNVVESIDDELERLLADDNTPNRAAA